jgi:flagellar motility protein MotE (MotC chaperone)
MIPSSSVSGAWSAVTVVAALVGTVFTTVYAGRVTKRQQATKDSLATLEWAREFEKRTQEAERKASAAEGRSLEAERRSIRLERQLADAEAKAEALVEIVQWVGQIVDLAHDVTDTDHRRLVAVINGGPPAYRQHR